MKIKDIEVIELTTEWTAFDETHRQSWGVLKLQSDQDLVGISLPILVPLPLIY